MTKIRLSLLVLLIVNQLFAHDTVKGKQPGLHHNYIINIVPDRYNKPLIGIVNIARGNQVGFHSSLFNWNQGNFQGTQISILNIVGGSLKGNQIAVVNRCADTLRGVQVGLINATKNRKGIQIGLINFSDTVSSGFVIGLLSIVRKGYQAIELGVSEMYPYNITYKIGLRNTYNSVNLSFADIEYPILGFGIGSLVPLGKSVFINPDFSLQNGILKSKKGQMSLVLKISYAISKKIHISAGPSGIWSYARSGFANAPILYIYENSSYLKNRFILGLRCSLRYNFRGV